MPGDAVTGRPDILSPQACRVQVWFGLVWFGLVWFGLVWAVCFDAVGSISSEDDSLRGPGFTNILTGHLTGFLDECIVPGLFIYKHL